MGAGAEQAPLLARGPLQDVAVEVHAEGHGALHLDHRADALHVRALEEGREVPLDLRFVEISTPADFENQNDISFDII